MRDLQKLGGLAALVAAATFIFGFALFGTTLAPYVTGGFDASQSVAFLAEHRATFYLWYLVIYVVFGIFLVVLSLALHERLKADAPVLAQLATAFGLIWAGLMFASGMVANVGAAHIVSLHSSDPAQAASAWVALDFVVNGLGGGNEIVGGAWVLLLSLAALSANTLPKWLNYLGIIVGAAGLVTVVPALSEVGAVFGLGLIVWFVWAGVVMLRTNLRPSEARPVPEKVSV